MVETDMSEPNEDIANQESESLAVVTEGEQNENNGQQPDASENAKKEVVMPKKRKEMEPRSEVWDSFTKIVEGDVLKRGKCNYCKRELKCETKINGTSALNSHLKICKKNPNRNKDDKQPTLQATRNEGDGSKCTLTAWRFDPEMLRKAFAEMIITDELPFAFSEKEGFRKFMSKACPRFNVPSRRTTTREVVSMFNVQKQKLKKIFKESCERVCLTTDTWTSAQKQNYMCVTAHFIDGDWKLQKKIIGFFLVKGHRGEDIGKDLERCLVDWGLDKVFTITVDNASANDGAINYIRRVMNKAKSSIAEGKYFHMRCAAHIINLVVTDGLKEIDLSVARVRAAVKFVKNSPARITRFKKCVELEKVKSKAFLSLDVPTRWNSIYLMLRAAATYEQVFYRYADEDPYYALDLNGEKGPGVPEAADWDNARKMTEFLEHFYKLTVRVSASLHCTAHIFFHEIADVIILLWQWCESEDSLRKDMAKRMIAKYNKYWGDHKSFNILIFIAVSLDPRYKLSNYIKIAILEMFGETQGQVVWTEISKTLHELFEEYGKIYAPSDKVQPSNVAQEPEARGTSLRKSLIAQKMRTSTFGITASKSELEKYLSEENEEDGSKFDIREWWKVNSSRFPVLSHLALDVLAIPISTVASESAFSTGGRILDPFRSSLTPFMVQALVCTQDWLRGSIAVNDEEDTAELTKLEEALLEEINGLNISKNNSNKDNSVIMDDRTS
ncbi:hypothetical protein VPH35_092303 [Triticum aestivum]